jgi:ATP-binding cassette subfamily C (CFTR/MRP) protein 4
MDSDRVMVMDQGRIVELASPVALLARPDGYFSKLVAHTGEQSSQYLTQLAREAHAAKASSTSPSAASSSKATLVITSPPSTSSTSSLT